MSRAFVKEDDRGSEVELPVDETPAPITPEGYAALSERLAALRSDPTSSALAKQLARRMTFLQVIHDAPSRRDRVSFGARVTVEGEDGAVTTWRVVGSDETEFHEGGLSVSSPVARALLGRSEGDEVRVPRPRGAQTVTVVSVEFP